MAGLLVPAIGAAFTSDGTTGGVVTIASTVGWYANQVAFISATGKSAQVKVVDIINATTMHVRIIPTTDPTDSTIAPHGPNYGYSDISGYTAGAGGRIDAPAQSIYVASITGALDGP